MSTNREFEMTVPGSSVTGEGKDDVIEGTIRYSVYHEKQTRHHPGDSGVEDIRCVGAEIVAEPDRPRETINLSRWIQRFSDWAENNEGELMEHAADKVRNERQSRADHLNQKQQERRREET